MPTTRTKDAKLFSKNALRNFKVPDDFQIRLPQLGLTMTEGMLVEWLVAPGTAITLGEVLCIVETDKIANEILADRDGVLEQILVHAEETIPVGTTLGMWAGAPKVRDVNMDNSQPTADPYTSAQSNSVSIPNETCATTPRRLIATPRARKLANQLSIDRDELTGSGPNGRIIAKDVESASASVATAIPKTSPPTSGSRLRGARKIVAQRMSQSQRDIPHFYLTASAEISELLWLHDSLKQKDNLGRITLTHWIASAVGLALAQQGSWRTIYDNDALVELSNSDVGIAVASDAGLTAPVARDVGARGLAENAAQITELTNRARENTLTVEDLRGGALTISNLGGFAVERVFPLINPGQSSILGIGREQAVFRPDTQGAPTLKRELGLVLACDHRVFNGVDGARFLQAIVELLEDPLLIVAQGRR